MVDVRLTNILSCRLGDHQCATTGLPWYSVVVNLPTTNQIRIWSEHSDIFHSEYFQIFFTCQLNSFPFFSQRYLKTPSIRAASEGIVPKNTICYSCHLELFSSPSLLLTALMENVHQERLPHLALNMNMLFSMVLPFIFVRRGDWQVSEDIMVQVHFFLFNDRPIWKWCWT